MTGGNIPHIRHASAGWHPAFRLSADRTSGIPAFAGMTRISSENHHD